MKKGLTLFVLVLVVLSLAWQCESNPSAPSEKTSELYWLNHHDTVSYVGIETCKQCHANVHKTFIHTGMGQSLGLADTAKSIAKINGHESLYDATLDLYYQPFWENNKLKLKEYRLAQNGDTSYALVQTIDYVIGSGHHTNSHLWSENGYYHQAPFTWYAQSEKLDFPPGFEKGNNARFNREIGLECMACHNAMPMEFEMGSTNKFNKIALGIDCERCHGPGGAHVAKIRSGNITDTAKERDPSIVNPKRLSAQLQFEICQRCHLQGNAVLKPGKSFFDFKPGMELKEIMQVFLPRYSNSEDRFIMASHADRFKMSGCYKSAPEKFTCTSCHNPHISVRETQINGFNKTCVSCHGASNSTLCSAPEQDRNAVNNNCVSCHMPPSQATDIPHVTVHDHYLRKPKEIINALAADGAFIELRAINDAKPNARDKALAYLQQFERFGERPMFLDSAAFFLNKVPKDNKEHLYLWTYYFHLAGDRENLYHFASQFGLDKVLSQLQKVDFENKDAWTAYRLAEAYQYKGDLLNAKKLYERAVELAPYIGDFRNKYASLLLKLNMPNQAEAEWKKVLQEQPYHRESLNNIAFHFLQNGRSEEAGEYLRICLARNPDYLLAWQNQVTWAMQAQDAVALKLALENVIRLQPDNTQAKKLYGTYF